MALFRTSLQVVAAFAIVIILFVIAYNLFSREATRAIQESSELRNHIQIFKGIKDMSLTTGEVYNTVNDKGGLFMNLKPSVNQSGGIEFSYNFWLYQDPSYQTGNNTPGIDEGLTQGDVVLLLRGNNTVQSYNNVCGENMPNIYVKCPLIKLQNNGDTLSVEFNTEKSIDVVREGAKNVCGQSIDSWDEANQHKVSIRGLKNQPYSGKWFMVTVIIQDTYPPDPLPFRNRVRVRIYINGVLELDQYVNNANEIGTVSKEPTILKPNQGNLYVMPQITINATSTPASTTNKPTQVNNIMMADLSYFNYVIDADTILRMYEDSFTRTYATIPGRSGAAPLEVSDRNDKGKILKSTSEI